MNPSTSSGTNRSTRNTDYHIVEQAGRFKVYDGAGRFRLTFATREAAQAYIDGKASTSSVTDGHVAFQVATAVLVALFLLWQPAPVEARTCTGRYPVAIPHGCRNITGNGVQCDGNYASVFTRINSKWIGACVLRFLVVEP